ncbi:MAG: isoprenylcysteine carboxyl methyltransferase [Proteobacteria bacterium]|nr:isoprenylcysteine carboxyl methyltransferase [Pseudomonadota bacterium]
MFAKDKGSRINIQSVTAGSSLRGIGLAFTNMLLATLFILFAIANAKSFLENPRLSVFLIVVTETIVAIFLIIRRDPDETRHTWQTWISTTCGTLAPFLLRPIEVTEDLLPGEILQLIGFILQIAALLSLNRSIGLLPAYRGVKSGGLYRWVRHPLYAAYVILFLGYLVNNQSLSNFAVAIFGIAFLVMRIHYEEDLLIQQADYKRYVNRTRWRMIPAVW